MRRTVQPAGAGPKQCSSCYSVINQAARKCPQCQAFQNWRRHIDATNATLALLLAFVSVLTIGGEPIAKIIQSLQPPRADVRMIVSRADLGNIHIVAQNSGNVIAAIGLHAEVNASHPERALPITLSRLTVDDNSHGFELPAEGGAKTFTIRNATPLLALPDLFDCRVILTVKQPRRDREMDAFFDCPPG